MLGANDGLVSVASIMLGEGPQFLFCRSRGNIACLSSTSASIIQQHVQEEPRAANRPAGVGAGSTDQHTLLLSGISALVAGIMPTHSQITIQIFCDVIIPHHSPRASAEHLSRCCRRAEHGSRRVHFCGEPKGH